MKSKKKEKTFNLLYKKTKQTEQYVSYKIIYSKTAALTF